MSPTNPKNNFFKRKNGQSELKVENACKYILTDIHPYCLTIDSLANNLFIKTKELQYQVCMLNLGEYAESVILVSPAAASSSAASLVIYS
jgi:hypothetical protein